jgi:hypothetical protein
MSNVRQTAEVRMNPIRRTRDRVLLSMSTAEIETVEQALAQLTSSDDAQKCLALLRSRLEDVAISHTDDILDAWVDGGSVQVRAISVYADPVDLGAGEARSYAQKILKAAEEADAA